LLPANPQYGRRSAFAMTIAAVAGQIITALKAGDKAMLAGFPPTFRLFLALRKPTEEYASRLRMAELVSRLIA
jgi:hypothetical protein